ncbi:GH19795 [Drosophila grimshawi]|uniref:GH19795 n=1 Tax=Drosophila grimshawi TaxID=7222 RepID=B4JA23_DROGR|nr:GH19795 [Drosophila grimshawi]
MKPRERSSLGTYVYMGAQCGTIVMLSTSGILAAFAGWPSIFYISGGLGMVWVVGYCLRGANSPAVSKNMSIEEKELIEMAQTSEVATKLEPPKESIPTPWKRFFTSPAFLALIATHCAANWGYWTLLTQIPSYMKNVLGKDITANALLSSLPYIMMVVFGFFFVRLSKLLQKQTSISRSLSRKLFNTIGQFIPMLLLVALGYVPQGRDTLAVVLLSLTVGTNAAIDLGFIINHIDLSPNFAGVLMGISNGFATLMSICGPLLVGIIVKNQRDVIQWRIVFFIAAGFYLVGNGLFLIFGRGDIQEWNDPTAKTCHSSLPQPESERKMAEDF